MLIRVSRIKNPSSTQPTSPFLVYTTRDELNDGNYFIIDANVLDVKYNCTVPGDLSFVSVTRAPMTGGRGYLTGEGTELSFHIILNRAMDLTSSFVITFPEAAEIKIAEFATSFSCYDADSGGTIFSLLYCSIDRTARTVTIKNYCQVRDCSLGNHVRFKMLSDFIQNFDYVKT